MLYDLSTMLGGIMMTELSKESLIKFYETLTADGLVKLAVY